MPNSRTINRMMKGGIAHQANNGGRAKKVLNNSADVASVAIAPKATGWLDGIDNYAGFGAMGLEMGLPIAVGAVGYAGTGSKWMSDKTGVGKNVSNGILSTKSTLDAKLGKQLGTTQMGNNLASVVDSAMSPIYKLTAKFDNLTGFISGRAAAHHSKAGTHGITAATNAKNLAPHLSEEMAEHVNGMLKAGHLGDGEALGHHSSQLSEMGHGLQGQASKMLRNVEKFAGKQVKSIGKATGLENLAKGQHNTLNNVKESTMSQGGANALWATAAAAGTTKTVIETTSDIKAFRELIADIKGVSKEKVTSGDALFGDLPHIGNVARRALLMTTPPRMILDGISQIFNIQFVLGKHPNILMMMAPQLLSQGIGAMTSGNILDTYKEMKGNEKKGVENDPELYVKLVGAASKELHDRLGAESDFAKEVGRIYAAKHATVKEVLVDAQNGRMSQLIAHIKHVNKQTEATKETPETVLSKVDAIKPNAPQHSQSLHNVENDMADVPMESFASRVSQTPTHTETART